jgi:hypothetical protein
MQAHYAACRWFVIRRYTDCYRNEQISSLRARRKHAAAGFRVRVFEARLRCRFDGIGDRRGRNCRFSLEPIGNVSAPSIAEVAVSIGMPSEHFRVFLPRELRSTLAVCIPNSPDFESISSLVIVRTFLPWTTNFPHIYIFIEDPGLLLIRRSASAMNRRWNFRFA